MKFQHVYGMIKGVSECVYFRWNLERRINCQRQWMHLERLSRKWRAETGFVNKFAIYCDYELLLKGTLRIYEQLVPTETK